MSRPETKIVTKKDQDWLFDQDMQWKEHWRGMPEFICEDARAFQSLTVNFESFEDVQKFAAIVEQKLTLDTRSIWYPKAEIGRITDKRWIDEKGK